MGLTVMCKNVRDEQIFLVKKDNTAHFRIISYSFASMIHVYPQILFV